MIHYVEEKKENTLTDMLKWGILSTYYFIIEMFGGKIVVICVTDKIQFVFYHSSSKTGKTRSGSREKAID